MRPLQDRPTNVVYSDVNPDVLIDTPFELVFNEKSVQKAIESIFATPLNSRPFRRRFGTKILDLLYQPVDTTTATSIESILKDAINTWESRISKLQVLVMPDQPNQQYYVEIRYSIPNLGNKMVNYKFNISK